VAVCSRCGRSICSSCYKPYADLALCPDCYHTKVPVQMGARIPPASPAPPPSPSTPPGVWYGPFVRPVFPIKYWWVPAALFLTAAVLIIFNAIALLSPAFLSAWVGLFPWVAPLASFAFILGAVLGLVILGGLVLFLLGFRILAAFLVIPAAIVSLFIGGGFIVGVIVGVVSSLLVLMNHRPPF